MKVLKENRVCERCGAIEHLQIHHISYNPEVTQIVCQKCHGKIHGKKSIGTENQFIETKTLELHPVTKKLLAETQAKILLEIDDKWSYNQIIYASLKSLSRELKLED